MSRRQSPSAARYWSTCLTDSDHASSPYLVGRKRENVRRFICRPIYLVHLCDVFILHAYHWNIESFNTKNATKCFQVTFHLIQVKGHRLLEVPHNNRHDDLRKNYSFKERFLSVKALRTVLFDSVWTCVLYMRVRIVCARAFFVYDLRVPYRAPFVKTTIWYLIFQTHNLVIKFE